jgi:glyoxylase-like metal-dependent hydrolase (beta-lactamase superfamily II)
MIDIGDIRPVLLGHYTMPRDSRFPGQKIVACAYLIHHPDRLVLFDTGIAEGHEEAERVYAPIVRRPLPEALAAAGVSVEDVAAVANCHFHLDHCGGNPLFPARPIFAQAREYKAASVGGLDYTLPSLFDFGGATLELHDGDADVASGVRAMPTPGHTPGHQSLLVETRQGRILLAGQAVNTASDFAMAHYAWRLRRGGSTEDLPEIPDWLGTLQDLDVRRVFFAHDLLSWEPPPEPL